MSVDQIPAVLNHEFWDFECRASGVHLIEQSSVILFYISARNKHLQPSANTGYSIDHLTPQAPSPPAPRPSHRPVPEPPHLQGQYLIIPHQHRLSPPKKKKKMSTTTTTTTNTTNTSPLTTTPTLTLTATYHNSLTSSTLTFTYPLPTKPPPPPSSSSGGAPPLRLLLPPLEAKTAYLKKLRESCIQLQGDLNDVLTEMMLEKDMDLEEDEEEGEGEEGEEGEEKV